MKKRKKPFYYIITLFLIFLFFLSAKPVSSLYELKYFCQDDICQENGQVTFSFNLYQETLNVNYLTAYIKDVSTDSIIAARPNLNLLVTPEKNQTFLVSGKFPVVVSSKPLKIVPCFSFYAANSSGGGTGKEEQVCGETPFEILVYTKPELSCTSSETCPSGFGCENSISCYPLKCGYCQYPEQHQCVSYQCCDSSQCAENEYCSNHNCEAFDCGNAGKAVNHSCTKLECPADEHILNGQCEKLQCAQNEKAENNQCVKIECNNQSVLVNGNCVAIKCAEGQIIQNQKCVERKCGFFQSSTKNGCSFNSRLFFKILIFLIIIIPVGIFLYLKFKQQHPEGLNGI